MGPFRSTKGASKQRRDQINYEISRIRTLLPLSESALQRLSQLQVMSLACSYIRKCRHFGLDVLLGHETVSCPTSELPFDFHKALMGFLVIVSRDGKLLYISDNVTQHLGHSMADLMTQSESIYDIVDKSDHHSLQAGLLGANTGGLSLMCRMNVSRSRIKQSGTRDCKIVSMRGHFISSSASLCNDVSNNQQQNVFAAICTPLITTESNDVLADDHPSAFKSVHKLDMSFIDINKRGESHLGYKSSELRSVSWYQLIHPDDSHEAREKHSKVIHSGQDASCSMVIRLLSKAGRWVWVTSVMQMRQSVLDAAETVVVCCHQVIDEDEAKQLKLMLQGMNATSISESAHGQPQQIETKPTTFYAPPSDITGDFSPITIEGTFSVWDSTYGMPFTGMVGTQSSIAYGPQFPTTTYVAASSNSTPSWNNVNQINNTQQQHQEGRARQGSLKRKADQITAPTTTQYSLKRPAFYKSQNESYAFNSSSFQDSEDFSENEIFYSVSVPSVNGASNGGVMLAAPAIDSSHNMATLKSKMISKEATFSSLSYTYPPTPEMYMSDVMVGSPVLRVDTRCSTDCIVPQAMLTPIASPTNSVDIDQNAPIRESKLWCSGEEWLTEIVNYLKEEEQSVNEPAATLGGNAFTLPPDYDTAIINTSWLDLFSNTAVWDGSQNTFNDTIVDPCVLSSENL